MSAYSKQTRDPLKPELLCGRCAKAKAEKSKAAYEWPHEWLLDRGYRYFQFYGNRCSKCKVEC